MCSKWVVSAPPPPKAVGSQQSIRCSFWAVGFTRPTGGSLGTGGNPEDLGHLDARQLARPVCACLRKCKMGPGLFFSSVGQSGSVCHFFFSATVPRCGVDAAQFGLPGRFTRVAVRGHLKRQRCWSFWRCRSWLHWVSVVAHRTSLCPVGPLIVAHGLPSVWALVVRARGLGCSVACGILVP